MQNADLRTTPMPLVALRKTERHCRKEADRLAGSILQNAVRTRPIAVHRNEHFAMDGHHRLAAARHLGLHLVPAALLDYDTVQVESWSSEDRITPEMIMPIVAKGRLLPVKTTRHRFDPALPFCDIPIITLHPAPASRARATQEPAL